MEHQIMKKVRKLALIVAGGFIIALGVNLFYAPASILGGGITALSILSNILLGFRISTVSFVLNIPILIFGYFFVDREFLINSTVGMIAMTIAMRLTEGMKAPSDNLITCMIAGGVIVGIGAGLMLRQNGSGGGTDVICRALNKHYSIAIGNSSLAINGVFITLGGYFLGIDVAVATIATIYICGRVVNYMVEGVNYKRTVIIVAEHSEEIAKALMNEFHRGVTVSEVIGAYSGTTKKQMICVINPYQTPKLRSLVYKIEPKAFVTVMESIAVHGGAFKNRGLDD